MKTTIVIPTYNEKDNVAPLTEQIFKTIPEVNILIVDDNSPDGTGQIADQLAKDNPQIKVMHRPAKQGLGRAYIDAFKYLLSTDTECIITMDADFSHEPKYIASLLSQADKYDFVVGSRYVEGGGVVNAALHRLILSRIANRYARAITRVPINDFTAGFVLYRCHAFRKMGLDSIKSNGYAFQIEIKYKLAKAGAEYKEVPIVFAKRSTGCSKMSWKIISEDFFIVFKLRFSKTK